jgi:hypothetical protein
VISYLIYSTVEVELTEKSGAGKTFKGGSWGLSSVGVGGFWGTVDTDDLERLYRDTVSFAFTSAFGYVNITFLTATQRLWG